MDEGDPAPAYRQRGAEKDEQDESQMEQEDSISRQAENHDATSLMSAVRCSLDPGMCNMHWMLRRMVGHADRAMQCASRER
jgi:hypothetical protein